MLSKLGRLRPAVKFRHALDAGRAGDYNRFHVDAGWSSLVAREPHKLEVAGSNPAPVTKETRRSDPAGFAVLARSPEPWDARHRQLDTTCRSPRTMPPAQVQDLPATADVAPLHQARLTLAVGAAREENHRPATDNAALRSAPANERPSERGELSSARLHGGVRQHHGGAAHRRIARSSVAYRERHSLSSLPSHARRRNSNPTTGAWS